MQQPLGNYSTGVHVLKVLTPISYLQTLLVLMFWYSWPSFLVLKLHYMRFIGGDTDPEVVWLASCNSAKEWQRQCFKESSLSLPSSACKRVSSYYTMPAAYFFVQSCMQVLIFIQKSRWRNALRQSHPLDWAQTAIPGFTVHVDYSEWLVHWLTIKKWPKLLPSYLDNERRKTQNRFHSQKMTHRSSVVLSNSELGYKQIWPQRMFQVPEDTGLWQINQTPCILFYLSSLQSNYLVDLVGLLEFHRVLCFLLDTTLCKHYLNTRAGEGTVLFRKEIQQSRGQHRAPLNRHWEAARSLNTQSFDSIVNVCGMAVDKRKKCGCLPSDLMNWQMG